MRTSDLVTWGLAAVTIYLLLHPKPAASPMLGVTAQGGGCGASAGGTIGEMSWGVVDALNGNRAKRTFTIGQYKQLGCGCL